MNFDFTIKVSGLDPYSDDWDSQFYEDGVPEVTVSYRDGFTWVEGEVEFVELNQTLEKIIGIISLGGGKVEWMKSGIMI